MLKIYFFSYKEVSKSKVRGLYCTHMLMDTLSLFIRTVHFQPQRTVAHAVVGPHLFFLVVVTRQQKYLTTQPLMTTDHAHKMLGL